jgi:hypothetical protein
MENGKCLDDFRENEILWNFVKIAEKKFAIPQIGKQYFYTVRKEVKFWREPAKNIDTCSRI